MLKCGNATQAAIAAGFSKKTAGQAGPRLLKNVEICSALDAARGPILDHAKVTLEGHLEMLATIREEARKAGQFGPANAAEANRGKVAGFYVDRHGGPDGGAIPVAMTVTRKIVRP